MRCPIFFRCLLAAVLFGLWSAPAGAITTTPSWKPREAVTSTPMTDYHRMEGADRSLAYDHHGNPGIAFTPSCCEAPNYARRVPGVGWVHGAVLLSVSLYSHPSLAYDRYERPAISFTENTDDNFLSFARFDGSVWQYEGVTNPDGNEGFYTSLAFDLLGRPAIAYHDSTNTSLKYVQDTDGDFSFLDETPVTVVNQFNEGAYASLVFDPLNRPMIAHYDSANANLRFSVQEPGIGWVTTTVEDFFATGSYPSIAIDPAGFPAIAYYDNLNSELRYVAWNGDAWNRTTVDTVGNVGEYPSLAFDPADGNPAIAYFDNSNDDLKLAWHNGTAWQTQTVDNGAGVGGNVGYTPSLAFNDYGNGFPSIAYFDSGVNGAGTLYFIEDPPAAVPEPASAMLLAIGFALCTGWRKRRLRR